MMTPNESWEVVFERDLSVARAAGDIESAQRLVMRQWWRIVGELDRIDRRWVSAPQQARAEEARQFERSLARQDMRRIIERIAQWPEAALGLLDHRDLKQWRPLLIGRLAAHPEHRPAMIERAFKVRKVRRGRFDIAQEFIAIGRADRDLGLLETTELLLQDLPDGIAPVLDALIAAYGDVGASERAMTLALRGIRVGHAQPFVELLQAGHVTAVPSEVIEALAEYRGYRAGAIIADCARPVMLPRRPTGRTSYRSSRLLAQRARRAVRRSMRRRLEPPISRDRVLAWRHRRASTTRWPISCASCR